MLSTSGEITKTRRPCNRQGDLATGLGQILSTEASSVADKHPRNLTPCLPKKGATTNLPRFGNAKQMISLRGAQVHVKHITQIKYLKKKGKKDRTDPTCGWETKR